MTQGARAALARGRYGKQGIEFVTWMGPEKARVVTLDVAVGGPGVDPSFTVGDNAGIVASDALRAHALGAFGEHDASTLPVATERATHALASLDLDLDHVSATTSARHWVPSNGGLAPRDWDETAAVVLRREAGWSVDVLSHGFAGLAVLAPGGSSFTGFRPDPLSDQTDAWDRPLHGSVEASWLIAAPTTGPVVDDVVETTRHAMCATASNSLQQLLTLVGTRLLGEHGLSEVTLRFVSAPLVRRVGGAHEISTGAFGITEATVSAR